MANEKRLIYMDDAIDELRAYADRKHAAGHNDLANGILKATSYIRNNMVIVDAVEVVRCKDCRHWHEETGWCNRHSHFVGAKGEACHPWESSDWKIFHENDFCSDGVRKPNEDIAKNPL